jgi:IS5 family transposase
LKIAQKKTKSRKSTRPAIKKQLGYLRTNITSINQLLNKRETITFDQKQYKYWFVIQLFYEQQQYMYSINTLSVDHRKVSTHQPHVRPIVIPIYILNDAIENLSGIMPS